jgi:hypothetical protein
VSLQTAFRASQLHHISGFYSQIRIGESDWHDDAATPRDGKCAVYLCKKNHYKSEFTTLPLGRKLKVDPKKSVVPGGSPPTRQLQLSQHANTRSAGS